MVDAHTGFAVIDRSILTSNGQTWQVRHTADSPVAAPFRFVDAVDKSHVWALTTQSLLPSLDGGETWTEVSRRVPALTTIHFVDPTHGWAIGGNELLRTSNGGRDWVRRPTPCPVNQFCFTNRGAGWVASDRRIFMTRDGGASWTSKLALPIEDTERIAVSLQCTSGGDAWAVFVGTGAAMNQAPHVAYHCDVFAGCSPIFAENYFNEPAIQVPQSPGGFAGPMSAVSDDSAYFFDSSQPTPDPIVFVLATDDGRSLSAARHIPTAPAPYAAAGSASFVNRDAGWVVADAGGDTRIFATLDGGRTWNNQYTVPAAGQ